MNFRLIDHIEWIVLLVGLGTLGLMNPYADNGSSFCIFEFLNFPYCPGEGLGHSIAFTFRGDFMRALQAHPVGPIAIVLMCGRIVILWNNKLNYPNFKGDN